MENRIFSNIVDGCVEPLQNVVFKDVGLSEQSAVKVFVAP